MDEDSFRETHGRYETVDDLVIRDSDQGSRYFSGGQEVLERLLVEDRDAEPLGLGDLGCAGRRAGNYRCRRAGHATP